MPVKIPFPITFNPHKHHFGFLVNELEIWKKLKWKDVEKEMLLIGNNLIDFYLGELDIEQICTECINYFQSININGREQFIQWLGGSHWKKIELSDQSEWMIRLGDIHERYIHIHPAKYSEHTISVRGTTLKTVLTFCIHDIPFQQNPNANLKVVNNLRKELLKLSPIKDLEEPDSKIIFLWKIFMNKSSAETKLN